MKLRTRKGEFQVVENGVITFRTPDYDTALQRMGLLEVDAPCTDFDRAEDENEFTDFVLAEWSWD